MLYVKLLLIALVFLTGRQVGFAQPTRNSSGEQEVKKVAVEERDVTLGLHLSGGFIVGGAADRIEETTKRALYGVGVSTQYRLSRYFRTGIHGEFMWANVSDNNGVMQSLFYGANTMLMLKPSSQSSAFCACMPGLPLSMRSKSAMAMVGRILICAWASGKCSITRPQSRPRLNSITE